MKKLLVLLASSLILGTANAAVIQFDISGLGALGSSVLLGIDFVDGDGISNSVKVGNIKTDGVSSNIDLIGGASAVAGGFLLDDAYLYNSVSIEYLGADKLGFQLDLTNHAPAPGMFADTLTVYLLDAVTSLPLIFTDESLGLNALFSWTATGSGQGDLAVYNPLDPLPVSWMAEFVSFGGSVPEPEGIWIVVQGILMLLAASNIHAKRGRK